MFLSYLILVELFGQWALSARADEVLGCGGYIKSHVSIDFSKVEVKLVTKQGIVKDRTHCAPNNGYYFLPLYDKGELKLELSPPPGWSFSPKVFNFNIDGSDPCSQGKDINFVFEGFGIAGQVQSLGKLPGGPSGVTVKLLSKEGSRTTQTLEDGNFSFSPVYPGSYTVSISHPKYKLYKDSIKVEVKEGNTELPGGSLVVHGYEVKGKILTADKSPVKNTIIALFTPQKDQNTIITGCDTSKLSGLPLKDTFLCHITTSSSGEFTFPVVPSGTYYVVPYYKEGNIHFQPARIQFLVQHKDVKLEQNFEVIGFTVKGRVINDQNNPIPNAKIFLNGEELTQTDNAGNYKLEKLRVGKYNLKAEAENVLFNAVIVNIEPSLPSLPNLIPSAFKVCGKVVSEKPHIVAFSQVGTNNLILSETSQQQFCQYLPPGKYDISVKVSDEDTKKGLQFFPVTQRIEVSQGVLMDLVFSQLKSSISGSVSCIKNEHKNDCEGISVLLKTGSEEMFLPIYNSLYSAADIHPGIYIVSLSKNNLCWKSTKQTVNVNTEIVQIPPFIQTGYLLQFVSTHDAEITYKNLRDRKPTKLAINSGTTSICLDAPGEYTFSINSCHEFESETVTYSTLFERNQIMLNAKKHTVTLSLDSDKNHGPIEVKVQVGNDQFKQIVHFEKNGYEIRLLLKPFEVAKITPKSDKLFFTPKTNEVEGTIDCSHVGHKFKTVLGKVFKGQIQPQLAGVIVTVKNLISNEEQSLETDSQGNYKFPPLESNFEYKITAHKDSYIFIGPDSNGKFVAQKLAEINVEVLDEDDKSPLLGVLLSLSGGKSYRRNLPTNSNGKITFHSLSASDYFLRPMMKEYRFEPASKIIALKEGETINVVLMGKRVAFSAFGKLITVNEEPVENANVIASGEGNCTGLSEEATTDLTGSFRIRGLQPFCTFKIFVQVGTDPSSLVERTSPEFFKVENIHEDIKNLHLTVFRPVLITDVLVKVFAEKVEHYRLLKIILYRESTNPSVIYSTSVESPKIKVDKARNYGILVHLPSIQLDNNEYSIHLEPAHSLKGPSEIEYFRANSSFRYIEMEFNPKSYVKEQPIKQTSIWTIVLILIILLAAYNIQIILRLLKDRLNFNIEGLSSYIPIPSNTKSVSDYDNDIDQIVQDINNVRKHKPKKTN
ncbi:BOS complex subunit NOMO3 isoform X2 [Euwallacea fornicatus]|uniref:BOS complex subunit NOMO3 isoform X2 n=1 Tax=Euwallacea fornicatus TaxID=995702 RepID=UPI0033906056